MQTPVNHDDNRKQYCLVERDDNCVKEFLKNNIKEDSTLEKIYCEVFYNSRYEY